jgi:hypothetical protein
MTSDIECPERNSGRRHGAAGNPPHPTAAATSKKGEGCNKLLMFVSRVRDERGAYRKVTGCAQSQVSTFNSCLSQLPTECLVEQARRRASRGETKGHEVAALPMGFSHFL